MALKASNYHTYWSVQTELRYYCQTALQEGNSAALHSKLQAEKEHQVGQSAQEDIEPRKKA